MPNPVTIEIFLPIETARLRIRRMAETDLKDFMAYHTHPEVLRHMPAEPFTPEQALRFLTKQGTIEAGNEDSYFAFAVEHKADAKMIGEVGIYLKPAPESTGDIGWSLHPEYQKQGYAAEAAQVLLTCAFVHWKLHRVTSGCDVRNVASFRLMERLGMRREGHLRQSRWIHGAWQDEYIYALLREEWLVQSQAENVG